MLEGGLSIMPRALRKLRHLRVLVVLATLGATVAMTAQPAMATGPFNCRDTAGNVRWTCEIGFHTAMESGQEVIFYTCTADANQPPAALTTAVSCYLADLGSGSPTQGENPAFHSFTGSDAAWANFEMRPPGNYWVCMQVKSTYSDGTSDSSQTNCSSDGA